MYIIFLNAVNHAELEETFTITSNIYIVTYLSIRVPYVTTGGKTRMFHILEKNIVLTMKHEVYDLISHRKVV